ncbi:hypothetical protein QA584_23795 [Anaerocolumna sp. AGMB13025]|uniref:hypothetical protein n=1 Tax=Anaerocolumna sp. AGMB13025 TaxID=3039116 RepID=UPI00241E01B7|nr:hypothetical protein [Anaerocolumna sp. AGMB13025]WFR56607.1 hypothetical protein QA584_23795 [Anaerocolumna sp. AGMB13025]
MGYAVVGYFDYTSEERIKALWKGMEVIGVDDYLIHSFNSPHIKFAMLDSLDLEYANKELLLLTEKKQKIELYFKKYGIYPSQNPFLTIDIAENSEIIELHKEIQKTFSKFLNKDNGNYFVPGIWKPDCQLTVSFDKGKLGAAVDFLNGTDLPFNGLLKKLGIIEFYPAKQLFSYEFSERV